MILDKNKYIIDIDTTFKILLRRMTFFSPPSGNRLIKIELTYLYYIDYKLTSYDNTSNYFNELISIYTKEKNYYNYDDISCYYDYECYHCVVDNYSHTLLLLYRSILTNFYDIVNHNIISHNDLKNLLQYVINQSIHVKKIIRNPKHKNIRNSTEQITNYINCISTLLL